MIAFDEAQKVCLRESSYTRMEVVLRLAAEMDTLDWWRLLGDQWTVCDNIAQFRLELSRAIREADRPKLDAMMTAEELRQHCSLPGVLTVYRGCYQVNKVGLSWTLDRTVAERFPRLNRYRRAQDTPIIVTGRVKRERAVLMNGRGEQEIISAEVRRVAVEPIMEQLRA